MTGESIDPAISQPIAVCLLSGGLDSMVVAAMASEQGFAVHALTVDYNQRHQRELESAGAIARALAVVQHIVLPLDLRQFGGSALTDAIAVPKDGVELGIPVTYVPARNLVFLSLALAWAERLGARDLFLGVNAIDYSGYPDCRPEFIASFAQTAGLATKAGVEGGAFAIQTPLMQLAKADIVNEAYRLGVDPAMSWSCYDPQAGLACGTCDSCRLRLAGFAEAGRVDPLEYLVR